jgi:hypothetical protein
MLTYSLGGSSIGSLAGDSFPVRPENNCLKNFPKSDPSSEGADWPKPVPEKAEIPSYRFINTFFAMHLRSVWKIQMDKTCCYNNCSEMLTKLTF